MAKVCKVNGFAAKTGEKKAAEHEKAFKLFGIDRKNEAKTGDLEQSFPKFRSATNSNSEKTNNKKSPIACISHHFRLHTSTRCIRAAPSLCALVCLAVFFSSLRFGSVRRLCCISGASKSVALFKSFCLIGLFRPPECNSACAARFRWLSLALRFSVNRLPLHKRATSPLRTEYI